MPARCRLVIAGAGLAGLELARQLERLGARDVVVIEAGPVDDLRHVNAAHDPDAALRVWLEPGSDPYFRRLWESWTPPLYTGSSGIRQRLGGRSLYWYGVILPIEEWALREPWWPGEIVADLRDSWQGGACLYDLVRHEIALWRGGEQAPSDTAYAISSVIDDFPFQPVPVAIRQSSNGLGRWRAYSPLDHWRDPETGAVQRRPEGIRFCTDHQVVKVTIAGTSARGVVVRSMSSQKEIKIEADAVVLAAGTIENTRLAVQALCEVNALSAPRLSGLMDHIVQGVYVQLARPHARRLLEAIPEGLYFAPRYEARSNLFLDLRKTADGALVDLQLTGEQMPLPESFVACDPSLVFPWRTSVCTTTSRDDAAVITQQQEILQAAWSGLSKLAGRCAETLVFADYNCPLRTNPFIPRPAQPGIPITWSSLLGTEDHEGGTLPLGTILDEDHQFAAISGLFAAGPASFPRMGAANPGLTILALARRLATKLAGKLPLR